MNALVIIKSGGTDDYNDQLKKCEAYAQSQGWNIGNVYSNEEETAVNDIGEYLNNIDVVLTTNLTRIARKPVGLKRFLTKLQSKNVRLFTLKDGELIDIIY